MVAESRRPDRWIAVAAGGAIGTLARYEVTQAIPASPKAFPWAIALVNVVGCVVVGAAMATLRARPPARAWLHPFVVVGVCGGLTTFSTWMVADVLLVHDGAAAVAALDLVGSLVAGLAAVWLAFRAASAVLGASVPAELDVRDAD